MTPTPTPIACQVEEDKGKERGTYLHPELFQQSPVVARK